MQKGFNLGFKKSHDMWVYRELNSKFVIEIKKNLDIEYTIIRKLIIGRQRNEWKKMLRDGEKIVQTFFYVSTEK